MKAKVYVVVTYHGYHGDDVHVFGRMAEAIACIREYAKGYWDTKRLGRFPRSYKRLHEAWDEHDLWGSTNSRWELEERDVELPDPTPVAPR
jgi:hypothetical protein